MNNEDNENLRICEGFHCCAPPCNPPLSVVYYPQKAIQQGGGAL